MAITTKGDALCGAHSPCDGIVLHIKYDIPYDAYRAVLSYTIPDQYKNLLKDHKRDKILATALMFTDEDLQSMGVVKAKHYIFDTLFMQLKRHLMQDLEDYAEEKKNQD